MIKNDKGGPGWAILAGYVALYDYWAVKNNKETLSAAFGRSLEHPIARWATIVVVMGLLKHLLFPNFLPQLDPLKWIAEKWREGVEEVLVITDG